jgi:hypothetical protein
MNLRKTTGIVVIILVMMGFLSTLQSWNTIAVKADPPPYPSVVQNGDFEAGTASWTYEQYGSVQGSFGLSSDVYSGSQSGKLSDSVYSSSGYCLVKQKVPLVSGNVYQITVHYKSSVVGSASLWVLNSAWSKVACYWARIPVSSSWATLQYLTSAVPTIPSGGFSEIRINIENVGQILIDDVSIVPYSAPTATPTPVPTATPTPVPTATPPPTPSPTFAPDTFIMKGTVVESNILHPNARNYQPNGWSILQDLGVNTISVRGGAEGDIWGWNINSKPATWASSLDNFLNLANNHGIKVIFTQIGDEYGTMFGIQCPEPPRGITGTPIAQAKSMIDKLAGNNALNRNFLNDNRVSAWSPAGEVDLQNSLTRDWVLQMLDYMRSKGATVYVGSPRNTAYSPDWMTSTTLQAVMPILEGHVDFVEIHDYRLYEVGNAKNAGQDIYTATYNIFKQDMQTMINGRGSLPLNRIILGEFGMWHGYDDGSGIAFPITFTEADRGAYYHAVYQVCSDLGIDNIFNYLGFAQKNQDGSYQRRYEIVDSGGVYFTQCTNILKQYYK